VPAPPLSRRSALLLPSLLATTAPLLASPVALAKASAVDWPAVKAGVLSVISDPASPGGIGEKGATIVRLAWHSSGTYDKISRTGGSGQGTIRFKEELTHGANGGLAAAEEWLEPVKLANPAISYADLYTYAGATAVEAMGGPHIPFSYGRMDAMEPSAVTPDGRLPEADLGDPMKTAAGLRKVFGRMGFGDQELVALSGAHALGRCHAESSGYVGPWQGTPTVFSNLYFKLLLKVDWQPDERMAKFQFKDPSGTLMMLPSDLVLVQDAKLKPYVELYAKDKKLFYKDFAAAFQKLEELGTKNLTPLDA
jgi:cytochrome c peroxidase